MVRPPSQVGAIGARASYQLTLALLELVDFIIVLLNCVLPSTRSGEVVPDSFHPNAPPPFLKRPLSWSLCKLVATLGRERTPDLLWYFANWQGVGHGGKWGEAHEPVLREVSRSPCPALK